MSATAAPPTTTRFNLPTRLNLGPLTTTFTPPPQCTTLAYGDDDGIQSFALGEACSSATKVIDNTSCWPPAQLNLGPLNLNVNGNVNGLGFYSPGIVCPAGFTTACTQQLNGIGTDIPLPSGGISGSFQFDLLPSETAIGCCPTGYMCGSNPSGAQTCVSSATSTAISAATCAANTFSLMNFRLPLTSTVADSRTTSITTIPIATAYAPMIQLNWQSSDSVGFQAVRTSVSRREKGKAAGRIVGAALGGMVGGMMMMGMMMMMVRWCRRRKLRKHKTTQQGTAAETGNGTSRPVEILPPYSEGAGDGVANKPQ